LGGPKALADIADFVICTHSVNAIPGEAVREQPNATVHSGAALKVGTALLRTMELFISNFGRFLVLALLPLLPLLYIAWATWSGSWSEAQRHFTSGVLALLFSHANAAILYGAILQMRVKHSPLEGPCV